MENSELRRRPDQRVETKRLCEILPYLFLGAASDVNEGWFNEEKISHIINATTQFDRPPFIQMNNYLKIPVLDTESESLIHFFDKCFDFIEHQRKDNKKVMVHCQAGKSRSATIAIAYIMKYRNVTMDEAHAFVRSRRPQIDPNFAFLGQLLEYQNLLQGKMEKVKQARPIDKRRILPPKVGKLVDLTVRRLRAPPSGLNLIGTRKRRSTESKPESLEPKRPRRLFIPKPIHVDAKPASLPSTPKSPQSVQKCPFPSRKIHSDSDCSKNLALTKLVRIRHSSAGEFNESE